jgi:uncharacterized membrane protein YgcG
MRLAALIALGLVFAAGLGLAGHLIARDTVALPVASIEAGERLAPAQATTEDRATTTTTSSTRTATTTETDDNSGRGRGRGRGRGGGDNSGSGSSNSGSGGDD